jgi:glycerol dehydrogenase
MLIFGAPARYVQSPGAITSIGDELGKLDKSAVLLVDSGVADQLLPTIEQSCTAAGITLTILKFSGECSPEAIEDLAGRLGSARPAIVASAGGGKCIDAGKGLGKRLGARIVTVPTIASNDSPTSHVYVFYDSAHRLLSVEELDRNPDLVLVDTEVIVRAPAVFLLAGIGDCLVKKYEVEACIESGGRNVFGSGPSQAALAMARGCFDVLRQDAEAALDAVAAGTVSPAFERVVEACILMSGLSFENGGLCIAHAMTRGLSAVPAVAHALHGLQVAYGITVQLALEGRGSDFMRDHANFYNRIGLPLTLKSLGLADATRDVFDVIADKTLGVVHMNNFPRPVSKAEFVAAMHDVEDRFG